LAPERIEKVESKTCALAGLDPIHNGSATTAASAEINLEELNLDELTLGAGSSGSKVVEPEQKIAVAIKEHKDGLPKKFVVTGARTVRVAVGELEVALSLNGTYQRTPSNTYSCVKPKSSHKDCAYQVLLLPVPQPHVEFEVLRLHKGFLNLRSIMRDGEATLLSDTEPRAIVDAMRGELCNGLPNWVLFAQKARSR
jgi:hypothetical protein